MTVPPALLQQAEQLHDELKNLATTAAEACGCGREQQLPPDRELTFHWRLAMPTEELAEQLYRQVQQAVAADTQIAAGHVYCFLSSYVKPVS